MTSLVAWIATSPPNWNSVYLASDSRISWNEDSGWNNGKKLFASRNDPDIIGYCGEVLFPSQILSQIIEHIDSGLLFNDEDTPQTKFDKIASIVKQSFLSYPKAINSSNSVWANVNNVSIVYGTRQYLDGQSVIYLWLLNWTKKTGWSESLLSLPLQSGLVEVFGSGKQVVKKYYGKWNKSEIKNTSRIVFGSFCDALKSGEDPRSGGAPQLVSIRRKGSAQSFGVIYNNERYLSGLLADQALLWEGIEWFNELFERCDGQTKAVLKGAQHHARPHNIS
jgi:hypothetical protein